MVNTNRIAAVIFAAVCAAPAAGQLKDAPAPPAGFPKFKVQEIATDLKIGYAVITCDVNGDGKPDIVVVDKERVIWYENPTWKVRPIITGKTKPDNVCIASLDIDGDGKVDFVLGAGWRPADTKNPGTMQWLSRGKTLDEEWNIHPIPCDEPTVHRVQVIHNLEGNGEKEIVMAPLQGRDSSAKGNWADGRPVRVMAYKVPANPTQSENWKPYPLSEQLRVIHNFCPELSGPLPGGSTDILVASYDGVSMISRAAGWKTERLHDADQSNPKASRGASEIKPGRLKPKPEQNSFRVIGTIEPWHGNQVVVYSPIDGNPRFQRTVLDDHLRWGHAVWFADLDGDMSDELVIGVRDNPTKDDTFTEKRGVRIYRNIDGKGTKWDRYILEDGGVAVEDLTVSDLNGDGKPDIIAVGRQTGNCRIYWNQGK